MPYQGRESFRTVKIESAPGERALVRDYVITTAREPIAPWTNAVLSSRTNKGTTSYAVALRDRNETSPIARWESHAEAEARRVVVENSLASSSGTIEVEGRSTGLAAFHGLLALVIAALSLLFTRSATMTFDPDRQTIALRVQRWPLPYARHTFRAAEVKAAKVSKTSGRNGASWELALILHDDTSYEILGGTQSRCSEAASSINRLLAKMR